MKVIRVVVQESTGEILSDQSVNADAPGGYVHAARFTPRSAWMRMDEPFNLTITVHDSED